MYLVIRFIPFLKHPDIQHAYVSGVFSNKIKYAILRTKFRKGSEIKILILPPLPPSLKKSGCGTFDLEFLENLPTPNPGNLPWKYLQYQQRANFVARIRKIVYFQKTISSSGTLLSQLSIVQNYVKSFEEPLNGFIFSLLTGDRSHLSSTLLRIFQQNGIAHILALSGLHFGIIFMLLYVVIHFFIPGRGFRISILSFFILVYLYSIGWKISMIRASIMGLLVILIRELKIKSSWSHLLSLAAFFMLIFDPFLLFRLSFQLSFAAVLGIFTGLSFMKKISLRRKVRFPFIIRFFQAIIITLFIQLFTLPLQILYFHHSNLLTLVNNLWCLPLFSIFFLMVMMDFLLFQFTPLSNLIKLIIHFLFFIMLKCLSFSIPIIPYTTFHLPVWVTVLPFLVVLISALNIRIKIKAVLIALTLTVGTFWAFWQFHQVRFYTLDMNQANAQLIRYKGTSVLVDCGSDILQQQPYYYIDRILEDMHINTLDALIITHPDKDHMGQLKYLLSQINVKNIYFPKMDSTARSLKQIHFLQAGDTFFIHDFYIQCYWPVSAQYSGNDLSLVFTIKVKNKTILITGDISKQILEQLITMKEFPAKIDFFNIPHHGSQNSCSKYFYNHFHIKYALLSCGYKNIYDHPSEEIVNLIRTKEIPLFRTDLHGCIKFFY
jgi:competence protein ComEC